VADIVVKTPFLPSAKAPPMIVPSNSPPLSLTEAFQSSEVPFDAIGAEFLWTSLTEAVASGPKEKGEPPLADLEGIDYSPGPPLPHLDP